jgi:hypothetical protein
MNIYTRTYMVSIDNRGVVLLNCVGGMNRKGLEQDGPSPQVGRPHF